MPAVCGAAIEVPLIVFVDVSVVSHADLIDTPGAYQSTHAPASDQLGARSLRSLAATVIAAATRAGDEPHASAPSLPAATEYATPSAIDRDTARSSAALTPPPRLLL